MPWTEILMLTIGVALIVTMICTGNASKAVRVRGVPATLDSSPRTPPARSSAFCWSPGRSALDHMRKAVTIFFGDPSPLYGFLRSSPLSRTQQLFFHTYIGTVGTYPSQGDHRDRGADALTHSGVGALFIGLLAVCAFSRGQANANTNCSGKQVWVE